MDYLPLCFTSDFYEAINQSKDHSSNRSNFSQNDVKGNDTNVYVKLLNVIFLTNKCHEGETINDTVIVFKIRHIADKKNLKTQTIAQISPNNLFCKKHLLQLLPPL